MTTPEEIIEKLIKHGLTKAEIMQKIKEKKELMKNLITDDTALFIIAREILPPDDKEIKLTENRSEQDVPIKDLRNGMRNVNIIGRIFDISDIKEFTRKSDGSRGYMAWFRLMDKNKDTIRVILWNDRAKYVKADDFKENVLIRIINASVKNDRNGNPEVHLGARSRIELNPTDIDIKEFPDIVKNDSIVKTIPIGNIKPNTSNLNVVGKIILKEDKREIIKRATNEKLNVMGIIIEDDTGSIPVTFWNEDIEKIEKFNEGDVIRLGNVYSRPRFNEPRKPELRFGRSSIIELVKKRDSSVADEITPISEALEKEGIYSLKGIVTSVEGLKEVGFRDGSRGKLFSFILSDDTGAIRITLWRNVAEANSDIKEGEGLEIKKIEIRYSNFTGRNEGIARAYTEIKRHVEVDIKHPHEIPTSRVGMTSVFRHEYTPISDINSEGFYEIKGYVANELRRISIYEACGKCGRKIENCTCPDGPGDPEYKMIVNLLLDDGTGSIRVSFIGNMAENLLNKKAIDIKFGIEESDGDYLRELSMSILGRDLIVRGRARFSDFSQAYELVASAFKEVDPVAEVKRILTEIG